MLVLCLVVLAAFGLYQLTGRSVLFAPMRNAIEHRPALFELVECAQCSGTWYGMALSPWLASYATTWGWSWGAWEAAGWPIALWYACWVPVSGAVVGGAVLALSALLDAVVAWTERQEAETILATLDAANHEGADGSEDWDGGWSGDDEGDEDEGEEAPEGEAAFCACGHHWCDHDSETDACRAKDCECFGFALKGGSGEVSA